MKTKQTKEEAFTPQPLEGSALEKVQCMRKDAMTLIECLVREETGVRDGDGFWRGCDPIIEIIWNLESARLGRASNPPVSDLMASLEM